MTHYYVSESKEKPTSGISGCKLFSNSLIYQFDNASVDNKTIVFWVKDASGNISNSLEKTIFGPTGLIAHYPFKGDAQDKSSYNNHGTLNGPALTSDRFGLEDGAFKFNGTSDYIRIDSPENFKIQEFSISAWIKWESGAAMHDGGGIFDVVSSNLYYDHFSLTAHGYQFRQFTNYPTSTSDRLIYDTTLLQDSNFHHVVTTYNGQSREIWLDGVKVNENDFSEVINYSSNISAFIGANFPGGDDYFKGIIDDIKLFNFALSSSEIQSLFQSEVSDESSSILGNGSGT